MILTGSEIRKQERAKLITIFPFEDELLNPNSYNYRLGEYISVITDKAIDPKVEQSYKVIKIPDGFEEFIPKEIIKTAAEICAYYSKAKNAKNVPVAYTESKHVQKYKGAKSGSVVIKGEKVVKVKPAAPPILPEGEE